jgi:AraC-like DNA-binding protein
LKRYRSNLGNYFISAPKISLNWLYALLLLILLHWLFVSSRAVLSVLNFQHAYVLNLIDMYSIIIFLCFTTLLVLKGLNQIKIFSGSADRSKYATSKLTDSDIKKYAHILVRYMETQKPYLKDSLSLDDLSKILSVPSWQLSQVINECFGLNFFGFVNKYRIEEAKQLLSDQSNGKRNVLEVLYEVGFNSKSAFNLAFKKQTGMTPTRFRKVHLPEIP